MSLSGSEPQAWTQNADSDSIPKISPLIRKRSVHRISDSKATVSKLAGKREKTGLGTIGQRTHTREQKAGTLSQGTRPTGTEGKEHRDYILCGR